MIVCLCGGIELVLLAWLLAGIVALLSRVPFIGDRIREWNQHERRHASHR